MEETVRLLESDDAGSKADPRCTRSTMVRRRAKALVLTAALLLLPCFYLFGPDLIIPHPVRHYHSLTFPAALQRASPPPAGYLVWSPKCRIPDIDPLASDAMAVFRRKKYISCATRRITSVSSKGVLKMKKFASDSSFGKVDTISCCYSNVTRPEDPKISDLKVVKSKCVKFEDSVTLADTEEFVLTKCDVKFKKGAKRSYEDAHTNVKIPEHVKSRMEALDDNSTKPWSVLIVGVDTISRINLARAMPKTKQFFRKNGWLDFQGYNKMDDNTYPNVMAVLTGRNQSRARYMCDHPGTDRSPDKCDFIWKRYQKVGYASAYGEDYHAISTFGRPLHSGFEQPPTDHYLQPLYIAVEKKVAKKGDKVFCTGQTTSGEQLFDYALGLVDAYANKPFFGFIWANTFSHDDVASPSTMDEKVRDLFEKLRSSKAADRTIFIFLSDHGTRFGSIRPLLTGFYEERLPAMLMKMPPTFKTRHPSEYEALVANTGRLTTPYDLFMTLEDILRLSGKAEGPPEQSEACPNCHSLFEPIPESRSCSDCSISAHWCTCNPVRSLPIQHPIAPKAIDHLLDIEIEKVLATVNVNGCRICAKLELDKLLHIYEYDYLEKDETLKDYLLVFSTKPGTMIFESTVRHRIADDSFEIQGIVSRLTAYRGKGECVKTAHLKKYCYCTHAKCT